MDPARIAALLHPFLDRPPEAAMLEKTSTYIDLLLRWNARINLTTVREPDAIVTRHFGESFFLARHLFPSTPHSALHSALDSAGHSAPRYPSPPGSAAIPDRAGLSQSAPGNVEEKTEDLPNRGRGAVACDESAPHVLDIGSGAGFPGLPLKMWAPGIKLTLIEANHKKAAFLREVVRALTLTNVDVLTERAETLLSRGGLALPPAGFVSFRAVEHFEDILPLAARFLAPSGCLALLIGSSQAPVLSSLAPSLEWLPLVPVPNSRSRIVAIGTVKESRQL